MPTEVELTPDRTRLQVAIRRDGKPPFRDRIDPIAAKQRNRIARMVPVDDDTFSDWCEQARIKGGAVVFTIADEKKTESGFLVRSIAGKRESGVAHAVSASQFVKTVLPTIPVDHVAEWDDTASLCCLDVDYHDGIPPDPEWLTTLVTTRLCPKPLAWHFSRSGGLHLFYVAAGVFTAEELAACAALRFRSIDATAGLELKAVVRGPGITPVDHYASQDTHADSVAWLGTPEFDETARDEWLEEQGMECGKRYEHNKCPIDPNDNDPGETKVVVGEAGIFCFRCNGKGLSRGSRRAGFVGWNSLLGSPSAGELGGMVRNLVHWGHARWVLVERYGLPEPFARLAYRAALKAYHDGKKTASLVPMVFDTRTEPLARVNDLWMTIDESYAYPGEIHAILACLPVAMYNDGDKAKPDPAMICEINQSKGIRRLGYRNIHVVHGYRLAARFLPESENTTVAVMNPKLVESGLSRRFPRYVIPSKRIPQDDAWGILERIFPRIDRVYIRTLIASFGCAQETLKGLPPIIYASGVSAAGKTAMTQIAAGIIGARIGNETKFDANETYFRAGIRQGAQEGPVVVINELLKDAGKGRFKLTAREALDFILTVTPNSASHQLYKGPVKMGRLPSLVITETQCPEGLREETQLARRIRHHYVAGEKRDWKETIANAGLTDLNLIRTVSDEVARACDAVMSQVVDDCFAVPTTWDAIADSLGVKTIEESTDFEDMTPWLRGLFKLVCDAPKLVGKEALKHAGGYKKIARAENTPGEDEDDLASVYGRFATIGDWADGRRLHEKDWGKILGIPETVRIDLKRTADNPRVIYIRFCTGPVKKPLKVNEEILNPADWPKVL